ncbi:hypothetical protein E3Q11_02707 [Wallemia mellicola]|nr:hypothetical protein E3Q11_02707 [Wallemia mellicola]
MLYNSRSKSVINLIRTRQLKRLNYGMRFVHARSISFSSFPRFIGRALRVPIAGVTVGGGTFAYANYKFEELRNKTAGVFGDITDGLFDAWSNVQDTLPTSETIGERKERFREWLSTFNKQTENDNDNNNDNDKDIAKSIIASVAVGASLDSNDNNNNNQQPNLLMNLTRKLIEIRSILLSIDQTDNLKLPSIVVIGSQSSGKSSVLEAIVGHEFLPKGNNMVTRRPIELTLIHTPDSNKEYGEFPSLSSYGKLEDFGAIQKILTDLNLSVPSSECVSDKPIDLRIYSPHVPDLTLIDLPGYVQIAGLDQPDNLREQISILCEKYIKTPNIILAVCAADVDLANSPALRASRRVDPLGLRTVGVITKMDMVTPNEGSAILSNKRYPLHLGYVGVVCKAPKRGIIDRLSDNDPNMTGAIMKREENYFQNNKELFNKPGLLIGTDTLRKKLMEVLENSMSSSLNNITNAVQIEQEEAAYQFKVQYNDRRVSPESYVAEVIDNLKAKLRDFQGEFSKPQVREKLESMLDDRVMNILEQLYWNDVKLNDLGKNNIESDHDNYWAYKLDTARSLLTKSGIGRDSTSLVADGIRNLIEALTDGPPFSHHNNAAERIIELSHDILRDKLSITSDQVENALKPFKFEVDVEDKEWNKGRRHVLSALEGEQKECDAKLSEIRKRVGGYRKLNNIISYLKSLDERKLNQEAEFENDGVNNNEPAWKLAYNPAHLIEARQAMKLSERLAILKLRMSTLRSSKCKFGNGDNTKVETICPEAFLTVVSEKLAYTSSLFLQIELLQSFFDQFPREIDSRLMYDLDRNAINKFARENPTIRSHLDLQERKDKLEDVLKRLESLLHLKEQDKPKARRFSLF